MMIQHNEAPIPTPSIAIDVVEAGERARKGWLRCEIGKNIEFQLQHLKSFCFAEWEAVVYDAMLVAGAVEFADRILRRPALTWRREIALCLPVHDPPRWSDRVVADALQDALAFLTGDIWEISFCRRSASMNAPGQAYFSLPDQTNAVIPFSDGLDSRAVGGLMAREMGDRLIRVRLGSKPYETAASGERHPFTSVPYKIRAGDNEFVESTARSRGFKFALISGLAAYLVKARMVIVPESGQGALGPALVTVGQSCEDYRNHPLFTDRMSKFLGALLGYPVSFHFPRLWNTKAETLRKFVDECSDGPSWVQTWSCWQQNRHVSVDGKKRHCGICAACMLRRLSVHAAGLTEPPETYVWEDLRAVTFRGGAATSFEERKITGKLHEYAIAGALHLDHLADLTHSPANSGMLRLSCFQLSRSLGISEAEARSNLDRLLTQHASEWRGFMNFLGQSSFVAKWALSTL
jgi:Queuosine biosynthesis protein QueC